MNSFRSFNDKKCLISFLYIEIKIYDKIYGLFSNKMTAGIQSGDIKYHILEHHNTILEMLFTIVNLPFSQISIHFVVDNGFLWARFCVKKKKKRKSHFD